jgi:hypothetical protein
LLNDEGKYKESFKVEPGCQPIRGPRKMQTGQAGQM